MKMFSLISVCVVSLFFISCKKQNKFTPVCDGSSPTYDANIKSIISQNCVSCHADYGTYSGLSSVLNNGKFESEVLNNQTMPQNGSLSEAQLNQIKCWAESSYPEN